MDLVSGSNKGFINIMVLIIIALVAFGLINIVVGKVFKETNALIQEDTSLSNSSKEIVDNLEDRYDNTMDGALVTMLVLLLLLGIAAGFLSANNDFWLVIAFVVMVILVLASLLLANVWSEFSEDDEYVSIVADYPMTNWVLSNFAFVGIGSVVIILVTIFIRRET